MFLEALAEGVPDELRAERLRPGGRGADFDPRAPARDVGHSVHPHEHSVEVQVTGSIQAIARAQADPQTLAPDTHSVARSEADDSGLCRADQATRRRFSEDLRNLTLAAPSVNRHQKRDHDASEWQPPMNRCGFASRVVQVKRAYGLSVDRRERDALVRTLARCADTDIDMTPRGTVAAASPRASRQTARASGGTDALAL